MKVAATAISYIGADILRTSTAPPSPPSSYQQEMGTGRKSPLENVVRTSKKG